MLLKSLSRIFALLLLASPFLMSVRGYGEAAILMEEPYGIYGTINPTGHNAVYFENICSEGYVHVRRCLPGELGSVISRYEGINGYDWVAVPLIPYLYSVEQVNQVPSVVDKQDVVDMREQYRSAHFTPIDIDKSGHSYYPSGWKQLLGLSYERRIYAFRFKTTVEQDDALIERLNSDSNKSRFQMLFRNCGDFAREILNFYFPKSFHRSVFPDAGITTPKQVTYNLVRYARKHPEIKLAVFEIPQIPGYRWHSHSAKNIAESFSTTAYAIPLTFVNPYLAGVIFVDYLFQGRYHLVPRNPEVLSPHNLFALTAPPASKENAAGAPPQVSGAAPAPVPELPEIPQTALGAQSGLMESLSSQ
jgi:hypothetical protein